MDGGGVAEADAEAGPGEADAEAIDIFHYTDNEKIEVLRFLMPKTFLLK